MRLNGKKAVVTGGSRGIGAAIARALLAEGAAVMIGARDEAGAVRTADGLRAEASSAGGDVAGARLDVTDAKSVAAFGNVARERLGVVDILVNNAGVAHSAPLARIELEDWQRLMDVNATGTFLCTKEFAPAMLERAWGRVVNVASSAGLHGARYVAAYTASKHAVVGFTRAIAAEFEGTGVTANAVCPGYVETDLTRQTVARIVERTGRTEVEARAFLAESSGGRILEPDEVAEVVVEFCSSTGSDVNGVARPLPEGIV